MRTLLVVALLAGSAALVVPVHPAHADGVGVVDSTWCIAGVGTWDAGTSTCTMSGSDTFTDFSTLTVPSGTTLVISTSGATGLAIDAAFLNQGTVEVTNTGSVGVMIAYLDTFTNDGAVVIANAGSGTTGVASMGGIFVNSAEATLTIENGAGTGFENSSPATVTLDNYGVIRVANSGGVGLDNIEALYNYASGLIVISNTGGTGLANVYSTTPDYGVIVNSGVISVCGGTTSGTVPTSGNPTTGCNIRPPIPPGATPPTMHITTYGGTNLTAFLVGRVGGSQVIYNIPQLNQTQLAAEIAQGDFSLFPNTVTTCSVQTGGASYIRVSGFFSASWGGGPTNSTELLFGNYQSFLTGAAGWPTEPACTG